MNRFVSIATCFIRPFRIRVSISSESSDSFRDRELYDFKV